LIITAIDAIAAIISIDINIAIGHYIIDIDDIYLLTFSRLIIFTLITELRH
jgi:hypothetical protein